MHEALESAAKYRRKSAIETKRNVTSAVFRYRVAVTRAIRAGSKFLVELI
jgi:hypothetical protein